MSKSYALRQTIDKLCKSIPSYLAVGACGAVYKNKVKITFSMTKFTIKKCIYSQTKYIFLEV